VAVSQASIISTTFFISQSRSVMPAAIAGADFERVVDVDEIPDFIELLALAVKLRSTRS